MSRVKMNEMVPSRVTHDESASPLYKDKFEATKVKQVVGGKRGDRGVPGTRTPLVH